MNCEPIYSLPQKIDIEFIRANYKAFNDRDIVQEEERPQKDTYAIKTNYKVLPVFRHSSEHLKDLLSLYNNEYLYERWTKFLSDKPCNYVTIHLYSELKEALAKIKPRPLSLNGKFYGANNKLNPIPYMADPRHYDPDMFKHHKTQSKQTVKLNVAAERQ